MRVNPSSGARFVAPLCLLVTIAVGAPGHAAEPIGFLEQSGQETRAEHEARVFDALARLSPNKLQALAGHVGVELPVGLEGCLCGAYYGRAHAHGGSYQDGKCWHIMPLSSIEAPIVVDEPALRKCLGDKVYVDGRSFPEVLINAVRLRRPVTEATLSAPNPESGLRRQLEAFRRACLPVPADFRGFYPSEHELPDEYYESILDSPYFLQAKIDRLATGVKAEYYKATRSAILGETERLIASAPDICEGAFAAKLYMDSERGLFTAEIAALVWAEFHMLDEFTVAESLVSKAIGEGVMSGLVSRSGDVSDWKSVVELLDDELVTRRTNASYKQALELFTASRDWTQDQRAKVAQQQAQTVSQGEARIAVIESDLRIRQAQLLEGYNRKAVASGQFDNPSTYWQQYRERRDALNRKARHDIALERMGIEHARLQLRTLLGRDAISHHGCKALIDKLRQNCRAGVQLSGK